MAFSSFSKSALIPENEHKKLLKPLQNFLKLCESTKGRMYIITEHMRNISRRSREMNLQMNLQKNRSSEEAAGRVRGFFVSPVGLGYLSIDGAKRSTKETIRDNPKATEEGKVVENKEQLRELFGEFLQLFRKVAEALLTVERSYRALGRDPENLLRLRIRIEDLSTASTAPSMERPQEVTERCKQVLTELEDLLTSEDMLSILCED